MTRQKMNEKINGLWKLGVIIGHPEGVDKELAKRRLDLDLKSIMDELDNLYHEAGWFDEGCTK